ncbi:alkaline phosphatase 4-like [Pollicipes pollicipes]|uniref:alkaline phosphatase 4-like n=1 Tax=Pollicipes pollicipes TaxID=41117 RepID=UPI0018848FFE|nr:alkaline phosphatase 4-like [Pollicipes pollicipes]XP_037089052.1 alkaline phosphatase 4-like [Pollicipes pollicipes]
MGHPSLVMLALSGALLGTHCSITEDQRFWYDDGSRRLREVLAKPPVERVARNVVLLVGDGMGMSTITAGRIYRGQQLGLNGEEYQLSFEKFSHIGLAKTYNVDAQVGDSAACATALFCGVKTKFHRIGVDASSEGSNCHGGRRLTSLIDWAQQEGKSTGLITNTRLTHSTPSAAYAHVRERRWESSTQTGGCKDIAQQLVEEQPGRSIDVRRTKGGGLPPLLTGGRAALPTGFRHPSLIGHPALFT